MLAGARPRLTLRGKNRGVGRNPIRTRCTAVPLAGHTASSASPTVIMFGPGETWGRSRLKCRSRRKTRGKDQMTKQLAERHWKTATLKTLLAVFVLPTLLAAGCSTGGGEPGAGSQERESAESSAEGAWPVVEVARKIEPCVVQVNVSSTRRRRTGRGRRGAWAAA